MKTHETFQLIQYSGMQGVVILEDIVPGALTAAHAKPGKTFHEKTFKKCSCPGSVLTDIVKPEAASKSTYSSSPSHVSWHETLPQRRTAPPLRSCPQVLEARALCKRATFSTCPLIGAHKNSTWINKHTLLASIGPSRPRRCPMPGRLRQ